MTFNYVKAWLELAWPAAKGLSDHMKQLFYDSTILTQNYRQEGSDLTIPYPPGFLERFQVFSLGDLEKAARCLYCYGHWSPFGTSSKYAGGTWKFSNLVDQYLRKELLETEKRDGKLLRVSPNHKMYARIHEGVLRICYEGESREEDYWVWDEMGPASLLDPDTIQAIHQRMVGEGYVSSSKAKEILEEIQKVCFNSLPSEYQGWWKPWLNLEEYTCTEAELRKSTEDAKNLPKQDWDI